MEEVYLLSLLDKSCQSACKPFNSLFISQNAHILNILLYVRLQIAANFQACYESKFYIWQKEKKKIIYIIYYIIIKQNLQDANEMSDII